MPKLGDGSLAWQPGDQPEQVRGITNGGLAWTIAASNAAASPF